MQGRLCYALAVRSLDDASFERISAGFAAQYLISHPDSSRFSFERGEGVLRFESFDAFSAIDGGSVKRMFAQTPPTDPNVVALLQPGWLRFDFRIRSALAFLVFGIVTAWLFLGGDPFLWFCLFIGLAVVQIVAIQRSIRRKVAGWLERTRWN